MLKVRRPTLFARRVVRVVNVASASNAEIAAATVVRRAVNGPGADAVAVFEDAAMEEVDQTTGRNALTTERDADRAEDTEEVYRCLGEQRQGRPGTGHHRHPAVSCARSVYGIIPRSNVRLTDRLVLIAPAGITSPGVVVGDHRVRADGPHHPNPRCNNRMRGRQILTVRIKIHL